MLSGRDKVKSKNLPVTYLFNPHSINFFVDALVDLLQSPIACAAQLIIYMRSLSRRRVLFTLILACSVFPWWLWHRLPNRTLSGKPVKALSSRILSPPDYSVSWISEHPESAERDPNKAGSLLSTVSKRQEYQQPDPILSLECNVLLGTYRFTGQTGFKSPTSSKRRDRSFFSLQHNSRGWVVNQHLLLQSWARSQHPRFTTSNISGAPIPSIFSDIRDLVSAGSTWPLSALLPMPSLVHAPCKDKDDDRREAPICLNQDEILETTASNRNKPVWDVFGIQPVDAIQIGVGGDSAGGDNIGEACHGQTGDPAINEHVRFEVDAKRFAALKLPERRILRRALVRSCSRLSDDVTARLLSATQSAGTLLATRLNTGVFSPSHIMASESNRSELKRCFSDRGGVFNRVRLTIGGSDSIGLKMSSATSNRGTPEDLAFRLARAVKNGNQLINESALAERLARAPAAAYPKIIPHEKMDERYTVKLHRESSSNFAGTVVSPSIWGALHGLVTVIDLLEGWAVPNTVSESAQWALDSAFSSAYKGCVGRFTPSAFRSKLRGILHDDVISDLQLESQRVAAGVLSATTINCNEAGRFREDSWLRAIRSAVQAVGITSACADIASHLPMVIADEPL